MTQENIKAPEGYKYEVVDDTTVRLVKTGLEVQQYNRGKSSWVEENGLLQSHPEYFVKVTATGWLSHSFNDTEYLDGRYDYYAPIHHIPEMLRRVKKCN